MRLAAVVHQDGTIARLPEGPVIHVWESSDGAPRIIENPGYTATSARRLATLRAMLAESVEAVCTPPEGFCPHSHREAVHQSVRFIVVDPGVTAESLQQQGDALAARAVAQLSPDLLAEPGHHAREHPHEHHHEHSPGQAG
ncbi:hypothetical protein [Limnochorda pilosa]|uniref:Dinitrogenase iron-molybdenum cofactor biosynthesis domain-containing protein n=1 Tax=Limnochorda pilosa TaxID=1555112 RepID=A0A0K2SFY4_LIMPI|nr:hypothetical protein [Limnochorda pilosa]BAS25947.1 hypothetical protein LIP_0090 [Limnochorda pilosa]